MCANATIDQHGLACDKVTFRGGQEKYRADEIFWQLFPFNHPVGKLNSGPTTLPVSPFADVLAHRGAWCDAVNPNSVITDLLAE